MRVPTMSAGTRSGVNWRRAKEPPMTWAMVDTVRVLASPGTPSIRQWPRASRQMRARSTMRSWPTMTRLTWNRASSRRAALAPLAASSQDSDWLLVIIVSRGRGDCSWACPFGRGRSAGLTKACTVSLRGTSAQRENRLSPAHRAALRALGLPVNLEFSAELQLALISAWHARDGSGGSTRPGAGDDFGPGNCLPAMATPPVLSGDEAVIQIGMA